MVESQFLGIATMNSGVLGGAKQQLESMQRLLSGINYTEDTAFEYLDTIYRISLRLQLFERYKDCEDILELLSSIESKIPQRAYDARIVSLLIKDGLMRNFGDYTGRLEIIKETIEYSIQKGKRFLLARQLNNLGNYYSNMFHNDLACAAYLLSASVIFESRNECSQKEYCSQLMFPFSNLISTMGQWADFIPLKQHLYEQESLDLSLRSFLGNGLKSYASSDKEPDFSFDKELYESICLQYYGTKDWESFFDRVVNVYLEDRENLSAFLEQSVTEGTPYDRMIAEIWDKGEEGLSKMIPSMSPDFFFKNIDLITIYYDNLSREDKDALLGLMMDNVHSRRLQMNYGSAKNMFEDITSGAALYSKKRAGEILLEHAGSNGAYEDAMSIFQSVKDYCGFPEGTRWIETAITHMRLPEELRDELTQGILASLEKHCTVVPHYNNLLENLYILRDFFSGKPLLQIDRELLARLDDGEKAKSIRDELSSQTVGQDKDTADCSEVLQRQILDYDPDSSGLAHRLFVEDIVYSTKTVKPAVASRWEDSSLQDDASASGVRESLVLTKGYEKLKIALSEANWEYDEKDLYLNCLIVRRGDEMAVLYLFNETDVDWLADEERFVDEDPLWFSMNSHVVSPVFRVKQHSLVQLNDECRKLVVMMPPTYVINAEDMESDDRWKGVTVVKLVTLLHSLARTGMLPESTDYKDLGDSQNTVYSDQNKEAVQDATKKTIKGAKEKEQKDKEVLLSIPWNLAMLYNAYSGNSTNIKYKPESSILYTVLKEMGAAPMGFHVKWSEILVYFYALPIKFRMRGTFNGAGEMTLEKFKDGSTFLVESYRDSELEEIKSQNGSNWIDSICIVGGDIAKEECSIVYRFQPEEGFRELENARQIKIHSDLGRYFRDLLTDKSRIGGDAMDWQKAMNSVSRSLLSDKIRQLAEQTAKSAIMSRNMSHNLGSHVMAYLKRDLFSVSDIMEKGVLEDFYPFSDALKENAPQTLEDVLRILEDRSKKIEMPFLVGLGRFISYLQERQDFIATVATDYIPYYSVVNFKDDIYDTLNPDYRYYRHMDRKGGRPENLLMKYIALSEGLTRDGSVQDSRDRRNDIVIKFRNFDGLNDFRNQKNRGRTEARGVGARDLYDMRDYAISLPGGIVGRQALFSILENLIRNSAKHGRWEKGKDNLEFTFDLFSGVDLSTEERSKDLFNFLSNEPDWQEALSMEDSPLGNYLVLTITDNLITRDSDYEALREAIKEPYVDENAVFIDKHKGIKEIRICAAWIRGIANDLHIQHGEPPVVTVRRVDGHIQYIFCVYAPVRVIAISDENRDILEYVSETWKAWRVMSPEDFIKIRHKSADVILVDGEMIMKKLSQYAPDRMVLMDIDDLVDDDNNPREEEEVYTKLVCKAYRVDFEDDYPILISDGKTMPPISPNIHLYSDDANVKGQYFFAYRTHHQFEQEFKKYMEGDLCKNMLGIEGITGGNSTDRLVRSEKLDNVWYAKHLCALRTRVGIFDERLFSKVTGLDDAQLIGIDDEAWVKASRDAVVHAQKRTWFFNVISSPVKGGFDIYGFGGVVMDEEGNYSGRIVRIAHIGKQSLPVKDLGLIPFIGLEVINKDVFDQYCGFFDYLSIHQGLMDKLYDELQLKTAETYPEEIRKNNNALRDAQVVAKCGITSALFAVFKEGRVLQGTQDAYELASFKRGLFIHSGRSKPSENDMPQRLPFIQYAAIEHAVYDCKYTIVELMKSALYE